MVMTSKAWRAPASAPIEVAPDVPLDGEMAADLADAEAQLARCEEEHATVAKGVQADEELLRRLDAEREAAIAGVASSTLDRAREDVFKAAAAALPAVPREDAERVLTLRRDARRGEELKAAQRVEAAKGEVRRHRLALTVDSYFRLTADAHAALKMAGEMLSTRQRLGDELRALGYEGPVPNVPAPEPHANAIHSVADAWGWDASNGNGERSIRILETAGYWPARQEA